MLGEELSTGEPAPDDGEFIRVRRGPLTEAIETGRESTATAWTLAALSTVREELSAGGPQ